MPKPECRDLSKVWIDCWITGFTDFTQHSARFGLHRQWMWNGQGAGQVFQQESEPKHPRKLTSSQFFAPSFVPQIGGEEYFIVSLQRGIWERVCVLSETNTF